MEFRRIEDRSFHRLSYKTIRTLEYHYIFFALLDLGRRPSYYTALHIGFHGLAA